MRQKSKGVLEDSSAVEQSRGEGHLLLYLALNVPEPRTSRIAHLVEYVILSKGEHGYEWGTGGLEKKLKRQLE